MRPLLALGATLFFITSVAFGGAKEHFINGSEYYESGEYEAAIEEFDKAYALDPKPAFLYNIAQSYEKMGKLREAVAYFGRFLDEDTKKSDAVAVRSKIANLEERIRMTGITVTATEAGAEIFVDDQKVGTTPSDSIIPLENGMHAIRIVKPGFEPFTMNVGVSIGYSVPVFAKLQPAPKAAPEKQPPATPPASEPPPKPTPEPESAPPKAALEPPPSNPPPSDVDPGFPETAPKESGFLRAAPWLVAGTGAAMTVTGFAVLGGIALANDDKKMAHVADGVGWPGAGIAAGGTIWGIVRIIKHRKKADTRTSSALPLPLLLVSRQWVGVAAAMEF